MTARSPVANALAVSELELEFSTLAPGVSVSGQKCPACSGGRTQERSLSVTRGEDGSLRWLCHRASCGFRGSTGARHLPTTASAQPAVPKSTELVFTSQPLPAEVKALLNERYCLSEQTVRYWNLRWAPEYGGRVILPVKGPNLEDRGTVLRTTSGAKPKTFTIRTESDKPMLAWFLANQSEHAPLYIVEDIYSALRLWQSSVHAVALMGTHLNTEKVREIGLMASALGVQPNLALDLDAFRLSVKYAIEYRDMCRMTATKINKDIKDMSEPELQEFLA